MGDICCLYSETTVEDGVVCGGTVNMKTRQGLAVIAFANSDLAQHFLGLTGLRGQIILPLAQLGDAKHSNRSKIPLPPPPLRILFSSEDALVQWHYDKENFDSAPYVTELDTARA